MKTKTYYLVGVYWPKEGGYGACDRFETLKKAKDKARWLIGPEMGYGKGDSDVHIIKRVESEVVKIFTG